jgi:hypothetical protein
MNTINIISHSKLDSYFINNRPKYYANKEIKDKEDKLVKQDKKDDIPGWVADVDIEAKNLPIKTKIDLIKNLQFPKVTVSHYTIKGTFPVVDITDYSISIMVNDKKITYTNKPQIPDYNISFTEFMKSVIKISGKVITIPLN